MIENKTPPKKRQHHYCRHWDHKWHGVIKDQSGRETCGTCGKPIRLFEIPTRKQDP